MANKKRQKPKDPKARANPGGFTKAGPNSRSGGRNRRASQKAAVRQSSSSKDILTEARESQRADRLAIQLEQRIAQAELAKELICSLHAGSLAEKVARLIIDAFPFVEVTKIAGKGRVDFAVDEMRSQLTFNEMQREAAIKVGINGAKQALAKARYQLAEPAVSSYTSAATTEPSDSSHQLVNA